MSNSYHAIPPVKDGRWARRMVRDSHNQITEFLKLYKEAGEKNDKGLYQECNELREDLITLQSTLGIEVDLVPVGNSADLVRVIARLGETLRSCPTFPPALLNNQDAINRFEARQTRSAAEMVIEGKAKEITTPNRHSVTGVLREQEAAASSSGGSIYDDTLEVQAREGADDAALGSVAAGGTTEVADAGDNEKAETVHLSISQTDQRAETEGREKDDTPFEPVKNKKKTKTKYTTIPSNFSIHSSAPGRCARAGAKLAASPAAERRTGGTKDDAKVAENSGEKERQLAGEQRDTYKKRLNEYIEMIKNVGTMVEDKLARGEELDQTDADLLSTVMDKKRTYHRRNSIAPSSVGPRSVSTGPWESVAYAEKATSKPKINNNLPPGAYAKDKPNFGRNDERGSDAISGARDSAARQPRRENPAPRFEQAPRARHQFAPRQEAQPTWNLNRWPFESEPLPPDPLPPYPEMRVLNSGAQPFRPRVTETIEDDGGDPATRYHSTPAPTKPAPPEVATPKRDLTIDATSEEVSKRILMTGMEAECRKVVASLRPPEKNRFNGDTTRFDYESCKARFLRDMKQPGMTDEIKVGELNYYFSGVALGFIDLYWKETDPSVQFEKIMARLD